MIESSKVTAISIKDRGKVTEIKDSSGRVLWNAIKRYVSLGDSIAAGHFINSAWGKTPYNPEIGYYAGTKSQYRETLDGQTEPNKETTIVAGSYTDLIRNKLASIYGKVSAKSFAHSGDTVADLIGKIESNNMDNPLVDELAKANIVTVCIGANDVLQDAMEGLEYYISTGDLSTIQSDINKNMAVLNDDSDSNSYMSLFNKLTDEINPNAQYIFTTVYNPYKYLHLDEDNKGFFEPLLKWIPRMNIDVDEIIEEKFLGGKDLAYPSISLEGITWTSIELDLALDEYIKDYLLDAPVPRILFERVNPISEFTEKCVSKLNEILRNKVLAKKVSYPKFCIAETKALFDTYPDRPTSASVHYNDLVHVAFTRGYDTALMDWGALWRDYGSGTMEEKAGRYWTELALKYLSFKNPDNFSLDVWDYVNFDINGFAEELGNQILYKVIVPNVDPHPTERGHEVLKQSFETAMK